MTSAGPSICHATARCAVILGGRGFVGSAVAEEAKRRGFKTVIVGRDEYDAAAGTSCDLLVNANGNSRKYLAAQDPKLEFDLSVRSVERSLHDFRADLYVHLSTIDVYADASGPATTDENAPIDPARLSPYGFHKWIAERLVEHDAARWLILRMGGFVGPRLWKNSIHDLLSGVPLRVHPDSEYQYLDTRELARIVFDLVAKGVEGTRLNACGADTVPLREVASWIPGRDLSSLPADLPRERYEASVERLCALRPVPPTRDTVRAFFDECRAAGGIPR